MEETKEGIMTEETQVGKADEKDTVDMSGVWFIGFTVRSANVTFEFGNNVITINGRANKKDLIQILTDNIKNQLSGLARQKVDAGEAIVLIMSMCRLGD